MISFELAPPLYLALFVDKIGESPWDISRASNEKSVYVLQDYSALTSFDAAMLEAAFLRSWLEN